MNNPLNSFASEFGVIAFLLIAFYAIVALLLPFIILGIYNRSCRIHRLSENCTELLALVPSREQAEKIILAIESQNTLTRQLLRAYGHEPEA